VRIRWTRPRESFSHERPPFRNISDFISEIFLYIEGHPELIWQGFLLIPLLGP
jgi:hypothetical protein